MVNDINNQKSLKLINFQSFGGEGNNGPSNWKMGNDILLFKIARGRGKFSL